MELLLYRIFGRKRIRWQKNWLFTSKTVEDEFVRHVSKPLTSTICFFEEKPKRASNGPTFFGGNALGHWRLLIRTVAPWLLPIPIDLHQSPPPSWRTWHARWSGTWNDEGQGRQVGWVESGSTKKNAEVSYDLLVPFCTEGTAISAFHQCRVLLIASPRKIRVDVLYIYIHRYISLYIPQGIHYIRENCPLLGRDPSSDFFVDFKWSPFLPAAGGDATIIKGVNVDGF